MNSFETERKNLLLLSKAKKDQEKALAEWDYLGQFNDNRDGSGVCELCGQQHIRYEFEIVNHYNDNTLLVGSECITKFGITVRDQQGQKMTAAKARSRVEGDKRKLVADAKARSVINSLLMLASRDPEFEIQNFIRYYQERGAFTPRQLGLLFWRLDLFHISHDKAHFKIVVRRYREKQQLLALERWKLVQMQPSLSPSQRDFLRRNGRL